MKLIITRLVLVLAAAVVLLAGWPVAAEAAEQTVKLSLGGSGFTTWSIGYIAPGSKGTREVQVTNTAAVQASCMSG
jgi:hypothetical protein